MTTAHLQAAWLHDGPMARLLAILNRDGEEARVIGGAVRNALMGLAPGDFDIATTALPTEVMRRAEKAGLKAVPTGFEHGTVTVVIDGRPFEVTTLREDVETFGRHATVRFGRDWRRDAERRDFTMNALSVSADGTVHDDVGGLEDLKQRRLRFIGDPAARIAEDYLRILRFFRFHAYYGVGALDPDGLHASIVAREGLAQLSRERVRMELMKLLLAPRAVATLTVMADCGILGDVLGGVPLPGHCAGMIALEAACGREPSAARRLAALAVLVTEDAERLWQRLRLTNAEHQLLATVADRWWRLSPDVGEAAARRLIYRIGAENFVERVMLAWVRARADVTDPQWRALLALPEHWTAPKFPLRAAQFLERGVGKGPALGAALRRAEEAWIAAGFPLDDVALRSIVDGAIAG